MSYSFEITRDDLAESSHEIAKYTRSIYYTRKHKFIYFVISIVFWFPVGLSWAYTKDVYGAKASLAVAVTALSLLAYKYISNAYAVHLGKQIPKDDGPTIGPYNVTIKDDGIVFKNRHMETIVEWDSIIDIGTTKTLILLYVDRNSALLVPKRDIDHERFLNDVRAHVMRS